jgi:hypothetical protein
MTESLDARGCDIVREFFAFLLLAQDEYGKAFKLKNAWNAYYIHKFGKRPQAQAAGHYTQSKALVKKRVEAKKRNGKRYKKHHGQTRLSQGKRVGEGSAEDREG